ncbi:hypothetical protein GCM10022223_57260 [Kineosporia mesophila]|uniref:Excreted virulence factor EspC (Type VII ESX diderm) n=1 Tax=Kineosporia mesophila TaxID=566012 RepID=A0ABP7AG44_9ACTN|nr:hypothetical protein [Kineosporia mesophila]MCD5350905.1 hypothetical protein [Kineosporia mesophila]
MSPRLHVDTAELHDLAGRVRSAASEASSLHAHPGPVRATMSALGDPALVGASHEFLDRWSHALGDVVGDAERLADLLALLATTCEDTEAIVARGFQP